MQFGYIGDWEGEEHNGVGFMDKSGIVATQDVFIFLKIYSDRVYPIPQASAMEINWHKVNVDERWSENASGVHK